MNKTIDFKKYSSIHIGPKVEVKVISEIARYPNHMIIGRGNNLLVSPNPPKIAILGDEFDYIIPKGDKLIVGASTTSGKLLTYARKNDLANFELLAKLPGNLGGIVRMNGGLKEWEIFNHLYSITTEKGTFLKEEIPHSYRHTQIDGIIYEVVFNTQKGYDKELQKMFNRMRDNQPSLPSAGSCFKNPQGNSAGRLIEQAGLKGHTIGGMAFSSIHANFLVNMGGGTFDEAMKLIKLAKKKVKDEFDVELEEEIIVI